MQAYHWKDGWWFSRLADGSIRMEHRQYILEGPTGKYTDQYTVDVNVVIDTDSWGSIVASMSEHGDTREAWSAAKRFHAGESNIWYIDEQIETRTN